MIATPAPDAVLFDMDGLLVDSEPVWTVAEVELARTWGGTWTEELKAQVVGTRLQTAVPLILTGLGHVPTPDAVAAASAQLLGRMVELFAADVPEQPGARALHAALRAAGVPLALVSSSYRVLVEAVLERTGLAFDLVVAGDEVEHGKPHPEPYLTACARLGADPARVVVLEDAPSGVASAEAAGCAVVAVPSVAGVAFDAAPRRLVVPSLEAVGLAELGALAAGPSPL